ncbi:gamma-glutamyl hydrolase A [Exaiptasia diaphana]|uniref:folate gamma-glutamyl hydrolase n=1 Tax=Exaiptasia diaphana TaxID=2652724 RepID=A0A913YJE4_EXADI|nr:gamma-glutamyl hydrolase A [Exaiptasia diaphana]
MHLGCISVLVFLITVSQVEMMTTKKRNIKTRQDIPESSKPVIGVLAQETSGKINKFAQGQYVLSTYVDLLQSVGARVVPILVNQTAEEVEDIFNSVNGLLIPGGHVKLQYSMYGRVGKQLLDLAIKANDKGDVFPIWAECLGLELIALLVSGRGISEGQYDSKLFDTVDADYSGNPRNTETKKYHQQNLASPESPEPPTKKIRPSFSVYQVETLKSVFTHKHYLGKGERKQLAADLNMTDEQVKTWFQNKRTKLKKKMSRIDDSYSTILCANELSYHGYPGHEYPGLRRTIDGRLSY